MKQYERVIKWKENRWFQSDSEEELEDEDELEEEEDFDGRETDDFNDWESYEIEQFTS